MKKVAIAVAFLLACLCTAPWLDAQPSSTDRELFRPPGSFREQVLKGFDELDRTASCDDAATLGFFFWWITDEEKEEIDDALVERMVISFDRADSRDGSHESTKCIAGKIASMFGMIGAKARPALPRLKKALARTEPAQPPFVLMNESSYDYLLRRSIINIEGE